MKFISIIILFFVLLVSCNTKNLTGLPQTTGDTVKFTYLYSEGLRNKMLGQKQLAKSIFQECLILLPGSSASAYQLAILYLNENDLALAREYSIACLNLQPDNEWYILLRAQIARKLNEIEIYYDCFQKLVAKFPENLNYNYEYATLLFEKKEYDKSLKVLLKIESEVGINEDISFLKNNINFKLNRLEEINKELIKLFNYYPDSIKYSDMLADFYLGTSQSERAFLMYNDRLKENNNDGNANIGLAWIYGQTGNFQKGYSYLLPGLNDITVNLYRKSKVVKKSCPSIMLTISKSVISSAFRPNPKPP